MQQMSFTEFKLLNKRVGNHFFSPDTMRFFQSRVAYWDANTGYFITSEVDPLGKKAYSVRKADFETGRVETVGQFHSHKSLQSAKQWLSGFLARGE